MVGLFFTVAVEYADKHPALSAHAVFARGQAVQRDAGAKADCIRAAGVHEAVAAIALVVQIAVVASAAVQRVIAQPARQQVVAGAAAQAVVTGITDQHVVELIAAARDGRSRQDEVFYLGGGGVVHAGVDRVVALAGLLNHRIQGVVDDVTVIPLRAAHLVSAGAAIEHVGFEVAEQGVVQIVAGAQQGRARQVQALDMLRQHIVDAAADLVVALVEELSDDVARVVNDIAVIAHAAGHLIGTSAAV